MPVLFHGQLPKPRTNDSAENHAIVEEVLTAKLDENWWLFVDVGLSTPSGWVVFPFLALHPDLGAATILYEPLVGPRPDEALRAYFTASGFELEMGGHVAVRLVDLTAINGEDEVLPAIEKPFAKGDKTATEDTAWVEALAGHLSLEHDESEIEQEPAVAARSPAVATKRLATSEAHEAGDTIVAAYAPAPAHARARPMPADRVDIDVDLDDFPTTVPPTRIIPPAERRAAASLQPTPYVPPLRVETRVAEPLPNLRSSTVRTSRSTPDSPHYPRFPVQGPGQYWLAAVAAVTAIVLTLVVSGVLTRARVEAWLDRDHSDAAATETASAPATQDLASSPSVAGTQSAPAASDHFLPDLPAYPGSDVALQAPATSAQPAPSLPAVTASSGPLRVATPNATVAASRPPAAAPPQRAALANPMVTQSAVVPTVDTLSFAGSGASTAPPSRVRKHIEPDPASIETPATLRQPGDGPPIDAKDLPPLPGGLGPAPAGLDLDQPADN